jgi:hypothetical protein
LKVANPATGTKSARVRRTLSQGVVLIQAIFLRGLGSFLLEGADGQRPRLGGRQKYEDADCGKQTSVLLPTAVCLLPSVLRILR